MRMRTRSRSAVEKRGWLSTRRKKSQKLRNFSGREKKEKWELVTRELVTCCQLVTSAKYLGGEEPVLGRRHDGAAGGACRRLRGLRHRGQNLGGECGDLGHLRVEGDCGEVTGEVFQGLEGDPQEVGERGRDVDVFFDAPHLLGK